MLKPLAACAAAAALAIGAAASPATAEIQKFMTMCEGKLCPSYRMSFTPPKGWEEDKAATRAQKFQVFVPRGTTFHTAPALIYIRITFNHDKKPVPQFITEVQDRWRSKVPDATITQVEGVERSSGKPRFDVYRFENPSQPQQAFEMVGYGEDGDKDGNAFIVSIVMTAARKPALDGAEPAFRAALEAN